MNRILKLFLIIILLLSFGCSVAEKEYSTVIFFIGDVKKNNAEIEIGDIIRENDIITTAIQSSCDIKIGESFIRIKEKSKLSISKLKYHDNLENTTLGLSVGKLLCNTKKLLKSESFMVKTPTAVAGVRGTKFIVQADKKKTTRIKVYKGKVKVVKRVKKLENKIEKLLDKAPPLQDNEKVIVTKESVKEAEKKVRKIIEKESKKGVEVALVKVVDMVKDDVIVTKKEIKKFKVDDFKEESKEIITVEEKPKEIIKKIAKIIKIEKKIPKPEGSLLVTRYEIYFIKNGKVIWEGKVINPPIKKEDKLYIASGDFVFCASADGPVLWKNKIQNNGKIEIKEDKLIVYSKMGLKTLDIETGQE